MEEHKPNHKPVPGIPEALHPEIGNGSALETDKHALVLRTPDASLLLTEYLHIPVEEINETDDPMERHKETHPLPAEKVVDAEATSKSVENLTASAIEPVVLQSEEIVSSPESIGFKEETLFIKGTKKKKAAKTGKAPKSEETSQEDSETVEGKHQKAGKLLRKAAKSVKKQEEGLNTPSMEQPSHSEATLSPFTSWLKNLAGSDYVHPYEDDFAFEQAMGPTKEGISETFADLLASQGYKERAREMYIKLMEKYPEKSGFFAAKIEALQ